MSEYNKAQKKCIKKWNDAFEYRNVTKPDFAKFMDEFAAIDPRPDPSPRYSVYYEYNGFAGGTSGFVVKDKPNITCSCYLLERLQETVHPDTGSTQIIGVEWVDGDHLIINEGEVVRKWTIVEDKND